MFRHRWLAVVVLAVVLAQDEWVAAQETAPRPNASDNLTPDTNPGQRKQQIAERDRRWEQANQLAADGKTAEAIQAGEQVLALERKVFGQTHAELTGTLEWLAQRYLEQADIKRAEERAVELLRVHESLHGKDHWQSVSARWYLDYLRKVAQVELPTLAKMLAIEAEYNRLYADGKYAEAAEKIQELVSFEERVLGDDHPFFANTPSLRADCLLEAGEFAAAETAAEQALQIRRRQLGDKHPDTAGAAWSLAQSRIRQEKHAEALPSLVLARDAWQSAGQEEDAAWMDSWRGDSLATLECKDEAKAAYQEALAAFRAMGHAEGEAQHLICLADLDGSVDLRRERDLLWDQAQQARSDGKLTDAATLGERMLAVERAWLGDDDVEVTSSLQWLAEVYEAAENWSVAEDKRRELLSRRTETLGEKHWQVTDARLALEHVRRLSSLTPAQREQLAEATGLAGEVTRLHDAGKYDRALEPARQALALRTKVLGAEHRQTATSLNNLAGLYRAPGDYSKAEPLYRQALDIRKKVLGEKHPDTAQVAWFLALSRIRQKKHAEALASLVLARDAWRSAGREENAAWMDSQRGDGLAAMERNDEAQAAYQAALAAFRAMGNAEGEARQLIRLADLDGSIDLRQEGDRLWEQARRAQTDGKLAEAAALGERLLAIIRAWLGDDHAEVTPSLEWLASAYEAAGNWPAAEAKRREVLTRKTETRGEKDWQVTNARLALEHVRLLGSLTPAQREQLAKANGLTREIMRLQDAGETGRALEATRQALALQSEVLGAEHPQTATSLNNLAFFHKSLLQYAQAEPLYRQALDIRGRILGQQHPHYASSLNNLASLYFEIGDYARAEPLLRQALDVRMNVLGQEHPDYLTSLNNLAGVYHAMGDRDQAEPLYRQVIAIEKRVLGEEHPSYATSLDNLAELYRAMGDYAQAEPFFRQAVDIRKKILGAEHPDYATSLNNLASLYLIRMDYAQAEPLFRQALDIRKKALGEAHPDYATSLNNMAELYRAMGDYAQAEPLFRQARDIRKKVFGEAHPDYATSLNNMAALCQNMGDYAKAEPLYRQARDIREKILGREHPDYATSLNNLAALYFAMGDYKQALPLYRQGLDIRKKVVGEEHPHYAQSLNNLALLFAEMGDYAQAGPLHRQARDIRKNALGEEHSDYAQSLNNLGILYDHMGDYAQAELLHRQALDIRKKALGQKHPDYVQSLDNLANVHLSMGDHAQAEPLFRQALEIRKRVLGEEHPDYAQSLDNLAGLDLSTGDYTQAERLYRQALDIREEVLGQKHPDYAGSLNNLAAFYYHLGDYAQAEPLYRQALDVRKKVFGEEHPDYASGLNNLAALYHGMGDYAQAESFYKRVLDIRKQVLAEGHPDYAFSLNNLGVLYDDMGDYGQAERLYRQALEIRKKVLGEDHRSYATSLDNLAVLYCRTGDYAQAEPLHRRALDIRKQALGEEHPDYAQNLNNLAFLYKSQGKFAQAEPLYRQASEMWKQVVGGEHPHYAISLHNLAQLHRSQGDYAHAEPPARQALSISRDLLEDSALVLSERQQLAMSQMLRHRLDDYLSLALKSGNYHVSAAQEALRWKGATLVRQRAMRLAADDPAVADGFRQLQQVARQLASLSRATPGENLVGWRERIAKLTAEKETLEAQLSRDSDAFREATRDVTLEQIQAALPDGGVLVDYLEFGRSRPAEQKGQWDGERSLLAIVVPRRAQPRLIELGPVAPIATAIDTWRQTFGRSPQAIAAGQALRERLWEPVLDGLEAMAATADEETGKNACRTILVSTDGVLGRLPLGALPGKQPDTYLIEDHRLAMIPVPQLLPTLVNDPGQKELSRKLLMVGDVDFDAQPQAEPTKRRRRCRAVGVDARFTPLPGTRDEILALNDLYRRKFGTDDDGLHTLRGSDANEARFRQLAPQFYHLHLATHGFFAPAEVPSALSDGAIESAGKRSMLISGERQVVGHNPGLLSGLAFAGANRDPVADADDGILTAQEIAFLPLGGVDTVVLSACDTGLGQVAGGEGLLGVQRSFQIAGARTTVASLWKVDDTVTVRLMDRFYSNLWKEEEMSRLDALREAQLWVLHHPDCVRGATTIRGATPPEEETPDRVPSYYWAAFVLSGDWR